MPARLGRRSPAGAPRPGRRRGGRAAPARARSPARGRAASRRRRASPAAPRRARSGRGAGRAAARRCRRGRRGSGSRRAPRARARSSGSAMPSSASSRTRHCTSATSAAVSRIRVCASITRTSSVPSLGCRRTSHQMNVGSGIAPQRISTSIGLGVLGVGRELARDAGAREGLEDRRARRREAAVAAARERRVGGQREQHRDVGAHAVEGAHGELGVRDRDVHVQRERRLAPRQLAQRRVQVLVAGAGGDLDVLGADHRMRARRPRRAGRARGRPRRARRAGGAAASVASPTVRCGSVASSSASPCVSPRVCSTSASGSTLQHVLGAPRRRAVRLEQHHLLLDAHRPRLESGVDAPRRPLGQDRFHPHARQRAARRRRCVPPPRSTLSGRSSPWGRAQDWRSKRLVLAVPVQPASSTVHSAPWHVDVHHRSSPTAAADSAWSRATRCSTSTCSRCARRKKPRVCFFPSASGDADHYVVRFYRHFSSEICDPSHISLFRRDCGPGKVREHLLKQDIDLRRRRLDPVAARRLAGARDRRGSARGVAGGCHPCAACPPAHSAGSRQA